MRWCAGGKTVKSLDNKYRTWAPLQWGSFIISSVWPVLCLQVSSADESVEDTWQLLEYSVYVMTEFIVLSFLVGSIVC